MSNPASPIYKALFGDPQALTLDQQEIVDAIPIRSPLVGRLILIATSPDQTVTLTHEQGDQLARALLAEVAVVEWLIPIVTGEDTPVSNLRTIALAEQLIKGVDGREAIVNAMKGDAS